MDEDGIVTIPVECPECESLFQLNDDLLGKTMRCPECQEIFQVERASTPSRPAPPTPEPQHVAEVFPVIEATPAPTAQRVLAAKPIAPPPKAKAIPGPKELDWSADVAPPTKPTLQPKVREPIDDPDDADDTEFIRSRPKKRTWSKPLLAGLVLLLLATLGGTGWVLYRNFVIAEANLAQEAETDYEEARYAAAQTKYQQLLEEFPKSDDAAKYLFFAELSGLRSTVGAVTTQENPEPAMAAFDSFVYEFQESPLAKPEKGYGLDILQTGQQLAGSIADHANDILTTYKAGIARSATDETLLTSSSATIDLGRKLLDDLRPFQTQQGGSLQSQRERFDALEAEIAQQRQRLTALAPFRSLAEKPTSESIQAFRLMLAEQQLQRDPEALAMLNAAETKLQQLVLYTADPRPAIALPADSAATILFSATPTGSPDARTTLGSVPDVLFGVARGILYTMDAETGRLLWGCPVSTATGNGEAATLPLRVQLGNGAADWTIVAGEWLGEPSVTARVTRTGETVWHQSLSAMPLAQPLAINRRLYIPLQDALGSVVIIDMATGDKIGHCTIRQPIGAPLATFPSQRPGVSFVIVPGNQQRLFFFEVDDEDAAGNPIDPRCVHVLQSDHPAESLRGQPLVIDSQLQGGPQLLIVPQTDGPKQMQLRVLPLPSPKQLVQENDAPQTSKPTSENILLKGWTWFPLLCNGERLALATDAGTFSVFGIQQPGTDDAPLYELPTDFTQGDQNNVARAQVILAREDEYWTLIQGRLTRLRTAITPRQGLRIMVQGQGPTLGEPTLPAQVSDSFNLGMVVVQPSDAANVQAVAFDLKSGAIRWKRQLGVTPATDPYAISEGLSLVVDVDAVVYAVSIDEQGNPAPTKVIAPPLSTAVENVRIVANGDSAFVVNVETLTDRQQLRVRTITAIELDSESTVPLPAKLAGQPTAFADGLLLPLANGYIYRYRPGSKNLDVGPVWRSRSGGEDQTGYLRTLPNNEFLATDGERALTHWQWTDEPRQIAGPWSIRNTIASAPVVVNGSFALLDDQGGVYLFTLNKVAPPTQRWGPTAESGIPPGKPSDGLSVVGTLLIYTVNHEAIVALDPSQSLPSWVFKEENIFGQVAIGKQLLVTTQIGTLQLLNLENGERLNEVPSGDRQTVALTSAIAIRKGFALLLTANGTGRVLRFD